MKVTGPLSCRVVSSNVTPCLPGVGSGSTIERQLPGTVFGQYCWFLIVLSAVLTSAGGAQQTSPVEPESAGASLAANFARQPLQLNPKRKSQSLRGYGDKLPLAFEDHGNARYIARSSTYSVELHDGNASISFVDPGHFDLVFAGDRELTAIPSQELPGKVNYIFGNDPAKWQMGLPTYERVDYHGVLPSVDLAYYGKEGHLEFDLIVKPGADLGAVQFRVDGAQELRRDSDGSLVSGEFRLKAPQAYQESGKSIPVQYRLLGKNCVGFKVGRYDRRKPLIIDPTLIYATRLGGGNSASIGTAIAVDSAGNTYVGGYTFATDFPTSHAAFPAPKGSESCFISKLNSSGTALIYSTYIGGTNFDYLAGIAVDGTGAVWATGYTSSSDFPISGAYQRSLKGVYDAFAVKLNPNGSLAYSTYLGGPGEDLGYGVAVDHAGNAYLTGFASAGFPTTPHVYQVTSAGPPDAFVTKFSSSGTLVWSTFLGGLSTDYGFGIAVDQNENAYVTGVSYSPTFPGAPPGGAQTSNAGFGDAFVAKLKSDASGLSYFTFLGGSETDYAEAISVNPTTGIAVISGETNSINLPVTSGAFQKQLKGGENGFVAKLNPSGSVFSYATYLGGSRSDSLRGIALDAAGDAYVAGYTNSDRFPVSSAIQPGMQGNVTSLFQTTNAGVTWARFDLDLPGAANAASPSPLNSSTIVAATENGIYRTTNGGVNWTHQSQDAVNYLARSPSLPTTIYGFTGSSVYQSVDDGLTWSFKGSIAVCCGIGIVADPLNPATAYVYSPYIGDIAVQKTVDNGVHWAAASSGLPASSYVTNLVAGLDGTLYTSVNSNGIYKSTNHGASWTASSTGLPAYLSVPEQGLVVSPSNPAILYASNYFTLYRSANYGATWTTVGSLPGGTTALAVSNTNPATLFYGAYDSSSNMWVSTNSGVNWTAAGGIGLASVYHIYPAGGTHAYAQASVSYVPVVAKIDPAGQHLLYSTFLGDYGFAYGIAATSGGDAFVTGYTEEFPTTTGAIKRNRFYWFNNADAFVTRLSGSTPACSFSIDHPQPVEPWYAHIVNLTVTAPSGCAWTAVSDQSWALIEQSTSGDGSGIVYVRLAADSAPGERIANLTIGGQTTKLIQRSSACYDNLSPGSTSIPSSGGPFTLQMTVGTGCGWSILNNDSTAVTVTSATSGTGNATIKSTVSANPGPEERYFLLFSDQGSSAELIQPGATLPLVAATITSTPPGASITVTGTNCAPGTYTTPANLKWIADTNCTVAFKTPQTIGGSQYTFSSASVNGGPATSFNPVTVNSGAGAKINANFIKH